MTVEELIKELKKYDPDMIVLLEHESSYVTDAGTWMEDITWRHIGRINDREIKLILQGGNPE